MSTNEPTQSKYDAALGKYNTRLDDAAIAAEAAALIAQKREEYNTPDVKKFLFSCIDLTTLRCEDNDESVMRFTQNVNRFDEEYPDLKNVAAICVYPNFAEIVRDTLEVEDVQIACVSGGFPSSQTFTEVKIAETAMALADGATEIDIVIPVGKFLAGDYEAMCDEIEELKETCKTHRLKVILETGALRTAEGSRLRDVPSHQGVLRADGTPRGIQARRRPEHRGRRPHLLHHRPRGIGRRMAEQLLLPAGHEPTGQPVAERHLGTRDEVLLRGARTKNRRG